MEPIVIRHSDTVAFKDCRLKWNYTSPHRKNLRPNKTDVRLSFGTSIHAGAEALYNPDKPYSLEDAQEAFLEDWASRIRDCFDPQQWGEYRDLGLGILENYLEFTQVEDDFRPVRAEVEFRVPIKVPIGISLDFTKFNVRNIDELYLGDSPVVFGGRIDTLGKLYNCGSFVIVDHKTAAKWGDLEHLNLDQQTRRYVYAMHRSGLRVRTVYYNELLKAIPCDPDVLTRSLKGGKIKVSLSRNRSQPGVTAERYRSSVAQHGLRLTDYKDHIEWLEANPPTFFRRTPIYISDLEFTVIERELFFEAFDMLNNPHIYKNPSRNWTCTNCSFRGPCIEVSSLRSDAMMIRNSYHEREPDE